MPLFLNRERKTLLAWCKNHPGSIVEFDKRNDIIEAFWDLSEVYFRTNIDSTPVKYFIPFHSTREVIVHLYLDAETDDEEFNELASIIEELCPFAKVYEKDIIFEVSNAMVIKLSNIRESYTFYEYVTCSISAFENALIKIMNEY